VDPIENRFRDEEARVQATRELFKCIADHRMAVKSVATYERDAVCSNNASALVFLMHNIRTHNIVFGLCRSSMNAIKPSSG